MYKTVLLEDDSNQLVGIRGDTMAIQYVCVCVCVCAVLSVPTVVLFTHYFMCRALWCVGTHKIREIVYPQNRW